MGAWVPPQSHSARNLRALSQSFFRVILYRGRDRACNAYHDILLSVS